MAAKFGQEDEMHGNYKLLEHKTSVPILIREPPGGMGIGHSHDCIWTTWFVCIIIPYLEELPLREISL